MAESQFSTREICALFIRIEREYDIYTHKIGGVYIWPLIRFKIYNQLLRETGLYAPKRSAKTRRKPGRVARLGAWLYDLLLRNPLLARQRAEYILFPHERKINGVDIYSTAILEKLGDKILIVEHKRENAMAEAKILHSNLARFASRLMHKLSRQRRDTTLSAFARDIHQETEVQIDIEAIAKREIARFRAMYAWYWILFALRRPKKIFCVVAYCNPAIVAAAHRLNIPVAEPQHGVITPYHMGYCYPGRPLVPYQPDELLCFGRFWYESTDLPGLMRPRVIGAPFMRDFVQAHENIRKDPYLFVFASQGPIGRQLFRIAFETAHLLPEYSIVYRLHPDERREDYEQIYQELVVEAGGGSGNLRISDHRDDETTYSLMAQASYKAGVSSTTLFEAIVLGCRVFVVDLPSYEYMYPVIERGHAVLVREAGDIVQHLHDTTYCPDSSEYYQLENSFSA